jgi:hypothetical protein
MHASVRYHLFAAACALASLAQAAAPAPYAGQQSREF